MRSYSPLMILSFCLCSPLIGHAQDRINIFQIFENFVISRQAAVLCGTVAKSDDTKFQANLMAVTLRAAISLRERNPGMSNEDALKRLVDVRKGFEAGTKNLVGQNGCSSENIKQLLKLYDAHTKMTLV